jgi:hypothetical protein
MMEFFKNDTQESPQDVKGIRETLLQFIKEQLKKLEGGEGGHVKGLHLFITCSDDDKHLYESAVYLEEEDRFRNEEVQRIADDFAIELPQGWTMETSFTDAPPSEAKKIPGLDAALFIQTKKRTLQKSATAFIKVLNGEAEKEMYTIHSTDGKVNIGREKKAQGSDGFFRINHIAFPGDSAHESNRYISRQHAHIQFDNDSGNFLLFADEGGVPPGNKIKVRSLNDSAPTKLFATSIGHTLQEGDQIMLGESAILEFTYNG